MIEKSVFMWQSWMTKLADSHYARQAKYFDGDSVSSAWEWLQG